MQTGNEENAVPSWYSVPGKEVHSDKAHEHRVALSDVTGLANSNFMHEKLHSNRCSGEPSSTARNSLEINSNHAVESDQENMVSIYASNTSDTPNSNDVSSLLEDQQSESIRRVTQHMSNTSNGDDSDSTTVANKDSHQGDNSNNTSDDALRNEYSEPPVNDDIRRTLMKAYQTYKLAYLDDSDEDNYDPVMVVELASGIFDYMKQSEIKYRPDPYYMDLQSELKPSYRSTLSDWIVQVDERFQLSPETLFLTINIIDRFLSKAAIKLNKFQLVGAVSMFIAAKYEEINCPTMKDFLYMLDNAYTKEEMIDAERFILNTLDFSIGWPGPMSFSRRISKADDYDYNIRTLAKYLLETTIMDARLIGTPPSWSASGAYFLSKTILSYGNEERDAEERSVYETGWTLKHVFYSGYTQEQVFPLSSSILENCRHAQERHSAIWTKYSDRRYHRSSVMVDKWIEVAESKMNS